MQQPRLLQEFVSEPFQHKELSLHLFRYSIFVRKMSLKLAMHEYEGRQRCVYWINVVSSYSVFLGRKLCQRDRGREGANGRHELMMHSMACHDQVFGEGMRVVGSCLVNLFNVYPFYSLIGRCEISVNFFHTRLYGCVNDYRSDGLQ